MSGMPLLDTLARAFRPAAPAVAPAAATIPGSAPVSTPPASRPTSPLAPAFVRGEAPQQAQIASKIQSSEYLGQNFKACLMEVAFANVRGGPTFYGYGTHKPMTASLQLPIAGDRLDLVVCLNVSGHDLKERADKQEALAARAKDNRYVIQVTHPDGHVEKMTGIEAKGALSTTQDISIRGLKPGKLVVEAWPEGSAGVGGYIEGRRLEITLRGAAADSFGPEVSGRP